MPSYGSLGSPSLRKMENGYGHSGRSSFSAGRIIGDPFALATISIGIVSIIFRTSWFLVRLREELTLCDSLPGSLLL